MNVFIPFPTAASMLVCDDMEKKYQLPVRIISSDDIEEAVRGRIPDFMGTPGDIVLVDLDRALDTTAPAEAEVGVFFGRFKEFIDETRERFNRLTADSGTRFKFAFFSRSLTIGPGGSNEVYSKVLQLLWNELSLGFRHFDTFGEPVPDAELLTYAWSTQKVADELIKVTLANSQRRELEETPSSIFVYTPGTNAPEQPFQPAHPFPGFSRPQPCASTPDNAAPSSACRFGSNAEHPEEVHAEDTNAKEDLRTLFERTGARKKRTFVRRDEEATPPLQTPKWAAHQHVYTSTPLSVREQYANVVLHLHMVEEWMGAALAHSDLAEAEQKSILALARSALSNHLGTNGAHLRQTIPCALNFLISDTFEELKRSGKRLGVEITLAPQSVTEHVRLLITFNLG